jgi:cell division protein ZapD
MNQNHEKRISDLREWAAPYCQLEDVIELILKTIRDSASAKPTVAENGFYQKPLDTRQATQLIRIDIDAEAKIYPEISAGKHRYSVRFMRLDSGGMAPAQVKEDVEFLLSRCAL